MKGCAALALSGKVESDPVQRGSLADTMMDSTAEMAEPTNMAFGELFKMWTPSLHRYGSDGDSEMGSMPSVVWAKQPPPPPPRSNADTMHHGGVQTSSSG